MFCLFFTDQPVANLADSLKADAGKYKKYFWSMLEQGIYVAPSPFETGFISLAHSEDDIEATCRAAENAFRQL
jgi:glutamate-1-semialdehyde 2,1-aminomutase